MPGPYIIMLVNERGNYLNRYPYADEGGWEVLNGTKTLEHRVIDSYDAGQYEATLKDQAEDFRDYIIVDGEDNPHERGAIWSLTKR